MEVERGRRENEKWDGAHRWKEREEQDEEGRCM